MGRSSSINEGQIVFTQSRPIADIGEKHCRYQIQVIPSARRDLRESSTRRATCSGRSTRMFIAKSHVPVPDSTKPASRAKSVPKTSPNQSTMQILRRARLLFIRLFSIPRATIAAAKSITTGVNLRNVDQLNTNAALPNSGGHNNR